MDDNAPRRQTNWVEISAIVALVGLLIWSTRRSSAPPIEAGLPLPEMMAEGWLNTDRPLSRDALLGKIVVIDCWATWCPPCRAAMPKLAKLVAQYQPLGVEFVGLTPEPAADRATIEAFTTSIPGFNWPVGYGTAPTLDQLGIVAYPTVIVFNPSGIAIWSGNHLDGLSEVLDEAIMSR